MRLVSGLGLLVLLEDVVLPEGVWNILSGEEKCLLGGERRIPEERKKKGMGAHQLQLVKEFNGMALDDVKSGERAGEDTGWPNTVSRTVHNTVRHGLANRSRESVGLLLCLKNDIIGVAGLVGTPVGGLVNHACVVAFVAVLAGSSTHEFCHLGDSVLVFLHGQQVVADQVHPVFGAVEHLGRF